MIFLLKRLKSKRKYEEVLESIKILFEEETIGRPVYPVTLYQFRIYFFFLLFAPNLVSYLYSISTSRHLFTPYFTFNRHFERPQKQKIWGGGLQASSEARIYCLYYLNSFIS